MGRDSAFSCCGILAGGGPALSSVSCRRISCTKMSTRTVRRPGLRRTTSHQNGLHFGNGFHPGRERTHRGRRIWMRRPLSHQQARLRRAKVNKIGHAGCEGLLAWRRARSLLAGVGRRVMESSRNLCLCNVTAVPLSRPKGCNGRKRCITCPGARGRLVVHLL